MTRLSFNLFTGAAVLVTLVWAWLVPDTPDAVLAVVWTTSSAWGCLTTLVTLRDVWLERCGLLDKAKLNEDEPDKILLVIATSNVRREILRAVAFATLFVLGGSVVAGVSTPIIGRSTLIFTIMLLIANALLDRMERQQTAPMLREAAGRSDDDQ